MEKVHLISIKTLHRIDFHIPSYLGLIGKRHQFTNTGHQIRLMRFRLDLTSYFLSRWNGFIAENEESYWDFMCVADAPFIVSDTIRITDLIS